MWNEFETLPTTEGRGTKRGTNRARALEIKSATYRDPPHACRTIRRGVQTDEPALELVCQMPLSNMFAEPKPNSADIVMLAHEK
jgi:hypothetical protein